jgi:hypothetical protein
MVYMLVTLFYRAAPEQVERECERRLKNFKPIDEVGYRYYRVAHLMRLLLCEQRKTPLAALAMTEVG